MSELREHCNLSDESFEERRKDLRETLLPKVISRQRLERGIALLFDDTPAMREQLDAFVAFEQECCSGLDFSVTPSDGSLRLEVLGLDPDSDVLAELGSASPQVESPAPQRGRWMRLLRSVGGGSALALLICCIAPIVAVALLGAAVAAPLVALDNPLVIVPAALAMGVLLFRFERKREERAKGQAAKGGCGC